MVGNVIPAKLAVPCHRSVRPRSATARKDWTRPPKERNAERPKGLKVMTKEELMEATYSIAGGNIRDLTYEKLTRLMTITQFVTDLCLREIEDRGELAWALGADGRMIPIVPYNSDVFVETVLNRPLPDGVVKL
jgi:hypothetical protein